MMKRIVGLAIAMFLLMGAYTGPAGAQDEISFKKGNKVDVMTQNLYVGADLFRVLTPEPGPFCPGPLCIPSTVDGILQTISNNDFEVRAQALAEEIKETRPDLIGLQEVSLIRTESPGDFLVNGLVDAEEVLFDYLEILLDALDEAGAEYEVAAIVENADIELPRLVGFAGATPLFDDARLTDRDVILARQNIDTSNPTAQNYTANLLAIVGGVPVEFTRGFVAVDAEVRGIIYRFVNTHLETGGEVQEAQAEELTTSLGPETDPVILVGDFNSSRDDFNSPDDTRPAYGRLIRANYVDMWTRRDVPAEGFTCCQDEDLLNTESILNERIDIIFVRHDLGGSLPFSSVGLVETETVGDEPEDKTPSSLWPSDHAGVIAELRIPRLEDDEVDEDDEDEDDDEEEEDEEDDDDDDD